MTIKTEKRIDNARRKDQIKSYVSGRPKMLSQIAKKLKTVPGNIQRVVMKMVESGELIRTADKKYTFAEQLVRRNESVRNERTPHQFVVESLGITNASQVTKAEPSELRRSKFEYAQVYDKIEKLAKMDKIVFTVNSKNNATRIAQAISTYYRRSNKASNNVAGFAFRCIARTNSVVVIRIA